MTLWSGQAISVLGSGISQLAYPLLALALTHSPAMTGLVATVYGLPYLLISLPAGAYIDRWDRKVVMIVCDSVRAVNAASVPVAAFLGHLTIAQLFVTAAIEGTCFVFFNVAETAALPRVVPKEQIPAASSQNQAAQAAGFLIAPPLAGVTFQTIGRSIPFLLDAVSYLFSVISLCFIRVPFQLERAAPERSIRADIMEGVLWLWRQHLIRYMVCLTGGLNFTSGAMFLVVLVLARHQGASPSVIGVMFAISSVGGLLGAIVASTVQKRFSFAQVIVTCVWIEGMGLLLIAFAPNAFVLGALGAVIFFVGPVYNAVQFSYRMAMIPDELQGRVNSASRMIIFGTQPLGSAVGGFLIQGIGGVDAALALAAVGLLLAAVTSFYPELRHARPYAEVAA